MNRPNKMNAMNKKMYVEMGQFFHSVANDSNCRVVLLTGAGKIFTSGIDLMGQLSDTGGGTC